MTTIKPLYINGKRDKARRYVLPSGEIISRRRYIILTEGVSPEEKHIQRVKVGKAKPGKTYQRYLERKAKKEKKERKQKRKEERKSIVIKEKSVWKEVWKEPKGYYQLQGRYRFRNDRLGRIAVVTGYSTVTGKRYPYESPNYIILRRQAVQNAAAKLDGYDWIFEGVIEEVWLLW